MANAKKVMVLGGAGYVGSALVPSLLSQGWSVSVIDTFWFGDHLPKHPELQTRKLDIRDLVARDFEGFDVVIHLANIANDPCSELDSKLTWEVNALATKTVVEAAIEAGVERFLFASSGSVYGVREEPDVIETTPLTPLSDYNKTKMVAERVLLSYADEMSLAILRPATICGYSPRTRLDLSVNLLSMQALKNKRITVLGGSQVRPNIHLQDMVKVYLHFLKFPELTGIYNAGFENLSISKIAELITTHIPAEVVTSPSNDPRSYRLSSQKLLATGFEPSKNVSDAIQEIAESYRAGRLIDNESAYNVQAMKKLDLAASPAL